MGVIFVFVLFAVLIFLYLKNKRARKLLTLIHYLNIDLLEVYKSDELDTDKFFNLICEKVVEKSILLLHSARRIFLDLGNCDDIMCDFLKKESVRAVDALLSKVQNEHTIAVHTLQIEMTPSKNEELMNKYPKIFSKILEHNFEALKLSEAIKFVVKEYAFPKPLFFQINFVVID